MTSAEEVGRAVLARFEARNQAARESGAALRAEIRELIRTHVGPHPVTAARILARLTRAPLPKLRTVQWHMRAIEDE